MTHTYDDMTLDELAECAFATADPLSGRLWAEYDRRITRRDAILDMAEALDAEGLVLVRIIDDPLDLQALMAAWDEADRRDADHG